MDSFAIVDDEGKLKVFPDAMFDSKKGKYVEIVKIIDLKIKI